MLSRWDGWCNCYFVGAVGSGTASCYRHLRCSWPQQSVRPPSAIQVIGRHDPGAILTVLEAWIFDSRAEILSRKSEPNILTLPHGAKFCGRVGLCASGRFQTGFIISCDDSGCFETCLNTLTKACFCANISNHRGRRYQNNKWLGSTSAFPTNGCSNPAAVLRGIKCPGCNTPTRRMPANPSSN